jgi:hypothetical protein
LEERKIVPSGLYGGRNVDATLTVQRLANALEKTYADLIDISDLPFGTPNDEKRSKLLTRALAAFTLVSLTDCDPKEAAQSITDGFDDEGIDAIHFDSIEKTVYLLQSKWAHSAKTTVDVGDCEKFLKGVRQLIVPDFSAFNKRIQNRETEIRANLIDRSDVRIVLVFAYTSPEDLGEHVRKSLQAFLEQQNNVGDTEVFGSEVFDLKRQYKYLSGQSGAKKIDLKIVLREWGTVDLPYRAYYGQVLVSDIAKWAPHGRSLFAKNLRYYGGVTDVNEGIEKTLSESPNHFWYFNNGITMLCNSVGKDVAGGSQRDFGQFDCCGVSVVNGAQTVGTIWEIAKKLAASQLDQVAARVNLRIINLEKCPEGFDVEVTRAANTQNPIRHRDYAALDPEQQRLAQEMIMDRRLYAFKSGEADPEPDLGCTIDEATVALACANSDIALAVQAKREVGLLWQDIKKHPYTTLFNTKLTAVTLWSAVQVARAVDQELKKIGNDDVPRGRLIAIHGNRFILHRVFRDPSVNALYRDPKHDSQVLFAAARAAADGVFTDLAALVQEEHKDSYLANVFKNAQKNKELDAKLSAPKEQAQQPSLFPDGH